MDLRAYATTTGAAAGGAGRRVVDQTLSELAARGLASSGIANVKPFRRGFDAARSAITAAIDRLDIRTMPEEELALLSEVMRPAIVDAHQRVLGADHLSEPVRLARVESEELCFQKLDVFIAAGHDKLRLERAARRHAWKLSLATAAAGFVLGIVSVLIVQWITH